MKPIGYIKNSCELITIELIQEIEGARKKYQTVGVGIYSDEFFLEKFGRMPIKPFADREKLIKSLKGVDFTFELNSEQDSMPEIEIISQNDALDIKKYHVGYAPGTYDLFHEGHLEHLFEVKSLCDILIVGVNSDDLVWENKKKKTKLTEQERITVVKNLNFVDYTFLVKTNDKSAANLWAKEHVGHAIDPIFLGSDLKNQDFHNETGIPIIFTERDPVLMQKRCSTYYREVISKLKNEI